jgi:catechol 2,3-dioxygenase-like lactoylglutathione lyase family enzyme
MIHAIDHINIIVADLERSVQFYTQTLGFREIRRAALAGEWIEAIVGLKGVTAEVVYVVAPAGEPRIELLHYTLPPGESIPANSLANTIGLRHIALRVEDIHTAFAQLQAVGVTMISEQPVVVPSSVITHAAGDKILCYFLDPDGVILELAEYR